MAGNYIVGVFFILTSSYVRLDRIISPLLTVGRNTDQIRGAAVTGPFLRAACAQCAPDLRTLCS